MEIWPNEVCDIQTTMNLQHKATTKNRVYVINIEWDYNYYQPQSDNEWLVDEMLAMLDEDITMQ